jgi:ribose transport system ATP-binding protein
MDVELVRADDAVEPSSEEVLRVENIVKRYPGVIALADVSLKIGIGEIHALLGENGAGKSTLIGILSGIITPNEGTVYVDGDAIILKRPRDAQDLRITTIHQELSLAPDLTVLQNVFLGREVRRGVFGYGVLNDRAMKAKVRDLAAEFGLSENDLRRPVGELGGFKQHVVEIVKALAFDARLVILDEPTSGLADDERDTLFEHMRALRDRGISILWVTHRLDELYGLADTITVLRDGRNVATTDTTKSSPEDLVRLMVGRRTTSLGDLADRRLEGRAGRPEHDEVVLQLKGAGRAPVLHDIDLELHRGEVLGIGGVAGAGRTELARIILGADRLDSGQISVGGRAVKIRNPQDAYRLGIAMVPEERKTLGILPEFSVAKNITISHLGGVSRAGLVLNRRGESAVAGKFIKDLGVRARNSRERIKNLSGGNQQKIILARCLFSQPKVIVFDEPTQGIDVAAKVEVYRLIHQFVDAGGAAIVISSEISELLHVSDRILVMREGRIAGEVTPGGAGADIDGVDSTRVMALAARSAKW